MGNAWAFLLAWWAARWSGGRVLLRMEDIDPERSKPEYAKGIREDLAWLGLDWEEVPSQSSRVAVYAEALEMLGQWVYPCFCSRKELRDMAGAPHGRGGQIGCVCRERGHREREALKAQGKAYNVRLLCPVGKRLVFEDAVKGRQEITLTEAGGDFALKRSDGVWAYQLAVVVDDAAFGVSQVVRGDDILPSTPGQLWLYELLGATPPKYAHIPLVVDKEGARLAKRHKSLTLRALRERGVQAEEVVGLVAKYAFAGAGGRCGAGEMLEKLRQSKIFPWEMLPCRPVYMAELEAWA